MATSRSIASTLAALLLLGLANCSTSDNGPRVALPDACPRWYDDPVDWHSNADSSAAGCVNRANRASMVETPADVRAGRPLGPASGARESLGVKAYEEGKVKPFKDTTMPGPSIVLPGGTGGQ
jgi:type IV pilus biogenesis protein CpaD/CtpE